MESQRAHGGGSSAIVTASSVRRDDHSVSSKSRKARGGGGGGMSKDLAARVKGKSRSSEGRDHGVPGGKLRTSYGHFVFHLFSFLLFWYIFIWHLKAIIQLPVSEGLGWLSNHFCSAS
eukprot:TRINITY_DN4018_c0_g1_i7.p1 TRINITY_DN4018_c0_g1~~TRINITY_DN4018_c0_g1_i7.p1  ORF type:complete len:118 (-),score=22.78 TRINITY_DN4018_c0_g1_i7:137-490(-)